MTSPEHFRILRDRLRVARRALEVIAGHEYAGQWMIDTARAALSSIRAQPDP